MRRIEPFLPLQRGLARVDDRRVLSGSIYVIRDGLMWRDAPGVYGPHKTLYNRLLRSSRARVFNRIFAGIAAKGGAPDQIMIGRKTLTQSGQKSGGRQAAPNEFTIRELVEQMIELTGSKSTIVERPLAAGRPHAAPDDTTLAWETLGWEPKVQLREGLAKTIAFLNGLLTREAA